MGLIDNVNVNVGGNGNIIDTLSTYVTKLLKPNIVNGKNVLTQEMMSAANTKYVIKYDYTLAEDITIPDNCILDFDGGSISGEHTITGNNTGINAGLVKIFDTNVTLAGSWNVTDAYPEWFGALPDGVTNCQPAFQKCVESFVYIRLQHGIYNFTTYNTTICTHSDWVDSEHIAPVGETIKYKTCIFLFSDKTFTMVGAGREQGTRDNSRIGTILKWSGDTILDAFIRGGSEKGNLSLQGFVVKGNGYDGYASDYSNGYGIQCAGYGKIGAGHHSLRDINVIGFNVGVRIAPDSCLMHNVTGSNGRIGIFVTGSLTQTNSYGPATSFSTIGASSCDIGVYIKNQGYSSISNIAVGYCRIGVKIEYGQCVNFNGIGAEDCFRPVEIRNCVSATFNSLFARRNTPEYISEHYPTLTDDGTAVLALDFESVVINGLYIDKSGNRQGYVNLYPKINAADSQSIVFYNFHNFVFDEVRQLRGNSYGKCVKVYLDNQNVLPSITPFVADTNKIVIAYDSNLKKVVFYDRNEGSPRWIEADGAKAGVSRRGTTRPAASDIYKGFIFFDETINKDIYWNGTEWKIFDNSLIGSIPVGGSITVGDGLRAGFIVFSDNTVKGCSVLFMLGYDATGNTGLSIVSDPGGLVGNVISITKDSAGFHATITNLHATKTIKYSVVYLGQTI